MKFAENKKPTGISSDEFKVNYYKVHHLVSNYINSHWTIHNLEFQGKPDGAVAYKCCVFIFPKIFTFSSVNACALIKTSFATDHYTPMEGKFRFPAVGWWTAKLET
jgi:hypothetical protein